MEPTRVNAFTCTDVEELFRIYANEYNNVEIHDRVLVFDIVQDGWYHMVTTDSPQSPEPNEAGKPTTSDEKAEENSPPSVGSELALRVLKQNEDDLENLPELGDLPDRKRPLSEKDNRLIIGVKRPWEYLLSSNEAKADEVLSRSVTSDIETPLPIEGVINADADTRIGSDEKVAETNDEPQLPSSTQTSPANPSAILRQHYIFVHATWLAVHSEYLRSLFYSGMKESKSKEVHIRVPESEENGHLMMLEAMYRPYILDPASVEELLLVLELAAKYSISFVFRKCKYVLEAMELSLEICEKIMFVVQVKHNMSDVSDLTNTIQRFLAKEFSPLDAAWEKEKFKTLSEPLLMSLLSSNEVTTQSENTVFHSLMHWIETNKLYDTSTSKPAPNSLLLTVVRFELLSIDYLYNVVQRHSIATKMAFFTDIYLNGIRYHALPEGIRKRHLVKPVERGKVANDFVQYTWVIQKDQVMTLADEATISSELFWWCGYKMQMSLKKRSYCFNRIRTTISLSIFGLTPKSEVEVCWNVNDIDNTNCGESQTTSFSEEQRIDEMYFDLFPRVAEDGFFTGFFSIGITITPSS